MHLHIPTPQGSQALKSIYLHSSIKHHLHHLLFESEMGFVCLGLQKTHPSVMQTQAAALHLVSAETYLTLTPSESSLRAHAAAKNYKSNTPGATATKGIPRWYCRSRVRCFVLRPTPFLRRIPYPETTFHISTRLLSLTAVHTTGEIPPLKR